MKSLKDRIDQDGHTKCESNVFIGKDEAVLAVRITIQYMPVFLSDENAEYALDQATILMGNILAASLNESEKSKQ